MVLLKPAKRECGHSLDQSSCLSSNCFSLFHHPSTAVLQNFEARNDEAHNAEAHDRRTHTTSPQRAGHAHFPTTPRKKRKKKKTQKEG